MGLNLFKKSMEKNWLTKFEIFFGHQRINKSLAKIVQQKCIKWISRVLQQQRQQVWNQHLSLLIKVTAQ